MEISHRSKTCDEMFSRDENGIRELLSVPDNYHGLFLQGGASLQFSMVAMNLLPEHGSADYVITGSWGKKALKEAKRTGSAKVVATMADGGFTRVPADNELTLDPDAAYVHITTNETIEGVEWKREPHVGGVPLVADASSDILSHAIPVEKYGLIYAGAQKNMGPSGVTLVILRDDLLKRIPAGLPTMLDYRTHVEISRLQHPRTPGAFISQPRVSGLKTKAASQRCSERTKTRQASLRCDRLNRLLPGHADPDSRSLMNVTYRLPSEELEKKFTSEATAQGLDGLKGHRSVGGVRASIYNAFPREGVEALVGF